MSYESVIKIKNISKLYKMYKRPVDRLKESLSISGNKYHEDFFALKNVSISISQGETIGLIGKNGSGKSTLLKMITGLITPNVGDINVTGSISAILELGAGFNPEFTGIENIYLNGAIRGLKRDIISEKIDDIINFADIGDFIYHPVKNYSSGMFARLAFSVAINFTSDILLVDEVLAVGDMAFQLKCMNKMKEIQKLGVTIIFVSHDIYSIKNFCSRAIWLNDGIVKADGDTYQVTQAYEDFMKLENLDNRSSIKKQALTAPTHTDITSNQIDTNFNDVLSITKVRIIDHNGGDSGTVVSGEDFSIIIDYKLNSPFVGIVGGTAIFDNEHNYVCGLNTKLDEYELPNESGKYSLMIRYPKCNLLSGTYFLDIGFMESSAIKILDYNAKQYSFKVIENEYLAEGMFALNHYWKVLKK